MQRQVVDSPHIGLLRILLAAAIASSAIHYTHNFVEAGEYPSIPLVFPTALAYRIGIVLAWPVLTGVALWGYRQYAEGRMRRAGHAFVAYSFVGISTIGHFLGGTPDIPAIFFVTIFTDFLTGSAMLLFGLATLRAAPPD